MFEKSGTKYKVEEFVEITLAGQQPFEAVVFLSIGDRLIDLLNDQRLFIPVKRMDNSTIIMAKSNIVSIVEKDPFANQKSADEANVGQDLTPQYDESDEENEDIAASDESGSGKTSTEEPPFAERKDNAEGTESAGAQSDNAQSGNSKSDNAKSDQQNRRRRRRKKAPEFDAYAILKVSPDASLEEIRSAYKSRIKAVHPDSVAALDLDEELIRAAIHTTQKVNFAYHHILKERKLNSEDEEGKAA